MRGIPRTRADPDWATRPLIDASPDAILAMDADRRLMEFNAAAEELSGYRRDDVLGKEMSGLLVPPRDRARFRAGFGAFLRAGDLDAHSVRLRVALLRADGTERDIELSPVPVTVGDKAIFWAILRDLTDLERSHAELAAQTERLGRLIATAIPGVLISDENGLVTNVSQSFRELFGLAGSAVLAGTPVIAVARQVMSAFADPEAFMRRMDDVLAARRPIAGQELGLADGGVVEYDYWPVFVADRYRGDLWLIRDLTQRKAVERQREQFLAIVSHELRTPLTSIVSFGELLRDEEARLTPQGRHFLDVIERNAERLLQLVSDLLMLDRLEAAALPLDLAPVSVPALVAEAVRTASHGAMEQRVTFAVDVREGPPVRGDRRRLAQVFDNLIGNAVKFSHAGGLVRVTAACAGRTWRIDVSDTGIGIPPAEAARLFRPFVRGSNARTAGRPGSGLGLAIVKVLTEAHGGRVEVDSAVDRGSTFTVFLPAQA